LYVYAGGTVDRCRLGAGNQPYFIYTVKFVKLVFVQCFTKIWTRLTSDISQCEIDKQYRRKFAASLIKMFGSRRMPPDWHSKPGGCNRRIRYRIDWR